MMQEEIICKCLRYIDLGQEPAHSDFGIPYEQYGTIWEYMRDMGLATNIQVLRSGRGNKVVMVFLHNSKVTDKGYKYLEIFEGVPTNKATP